MTCEFTFLLTYLSTMTALSSTVPKNVNTSWRYGTALVIVLNSMFAPHKLLNPLNCGERIELFDKH